MVYWLVFLGIVLAIGVWQLVVWLGEIRDKNRKYRKAREYARKTGKPLLVAGGPWGARPLRRLLRIPAHGNGDVCLDIDRRALVGHPNCVVADVSQIPFADRCFGAVFASHLLEHLPSKEDARKALAEFDRVSEAVFIAYPSRYSIAAWSMTEHHLWIWQEDGLTFFRERGRFGRAAKEKYVGSARQRAY